MFYIKCGKEYHPWRGLLKKWIQHKTQEKKTEENLERDLVNSKKERSSEKFKTPRNCKENSGDEIFRILSHMSKQRKEINGSDEKFKTPRNCKENSGDEIFRILSEMSKQRREIIDSMPKKKFCMSQKEIEQRE